MTWSLAAPRCRSRVVAVHEREQPHAPVRRLATQEGTEGRISRGRLWIPMHVLFELTLVAGLVAAWDCPVVRWWLLVALVAHEVTRAWSAVDFIPKALRFERGDGTLTRAVARAGP